MKSGEDRGVPDVIARGNPQIGKAVGILKELSADERTRMLYEDREKARRDIASLMGGARREGHAEGHAEGLAEGLAEGVANTARNLLALDAPIDMIIKATGLTYEEIESLG